MCLPLDEIFMLGKWKAGEVIVLVGLEKAKRLEVDRALQSAYPETTLCVRISHIKQ